MCSLGQIEVDMCQHRLSPRWPFWVMTLWSFITPMLTQNRVVLVARFAMIAIFDFQMAISQLFEELQE